MSLLHDGMDHGDMDMDGNETMCSMNMSFHWGACEFILFKSWQANTVPKFIAACIVFFLLAILYEGLKYYREVLFIQSQQQSRETIVTTSNGEATRVTKSYVQLSVKERMFNNHHYIQTLLHLVQVFISYILMLIVMLCNLYLILAICIGAATGYFGFGWLRKLSFNDMTECCH